MGVYRQKKSSEWYIDYYLPGGKRVREVAGHSKKLAEKLLSKRKAEILEGKYDVNRPAPIQFQELVDKFFKFAEHNIKPSSLERYKVSSRQLEPCFNGKFINQITIYDIEQYKIQRIKYRSPSTVNRDLAFLRRIFKLAKKWGMLRDSPMDGVQLYREDNIRTRYFTLDEIKLLLKTSLRVPHLHLAIVIALNTGMRRGEILSLRIPCPGMELDKLNWIDMENRCFHLNNTKSNKYRDVPINNVLFPIIEEAIQLAKDNRLFTMKDIKTSWKTTIRWANIQDALFHDLRRTFISHAMMDGYSQEVIQRVVGQEDPSIFKRYAHLAPDMRNKVVERMGNIFNVES